MNYRNRTVVLRQKNMDIGIPFFQTSDGYGIFWDNYSTTTFRDSPDATAFESETGGCIDYYFMNGGDADRVIAWMRRLTGNAPMFPRWAFGFWQSRERYKSQTGLVERPRARGSLSSPDRPLPGSSVTLRPYGRAIYRAPGRYSAIRSQGD